MLLGESEADRYVITGWIEMSERWLGVQVSGAGVILVDAEVPADGPITIVLDDSLKLASGDRAKAFCTMYSRLHDYAKEKGIKRAFIKDSAVSKGRKSGGSCYLIPQFFPIQATGSARLLDPRQMR
ncbi:hypothetical protein GGE16_003073 [Rhizobium leguminosarum]|uniref:Uncharacterized protein n=1 Tax=Rhizobium leguminosarum TaxID=384 RepID=A0AAE2SXY9_RHILE|nr:MULTISPECIES: hypothetical protein [Rhizobium]MBB4291014.1 hypothetical protein [Rhizobium leguminosarum]MBB4297890.1 hypothetical protein [Rhizobium leguminosarum]MBB4309029.1 hypothetical protein [Rhizobium leguminosarum]MBB4416866.1 hypothetical protein [Rhizobium leguminosarum]MBB4430165.1 hypothetical protein [Rhizobium esperanzae]